MTFVFILALLILGFIAASDFIENKFAQSKVGLNLIKPYSNWVGLVSLVLGFYWLFRILRYLINAFRYAPVYTLISLVSISLLISLGLLFSQSLINQFTGKNETVNGFISKITNKVEPLKEKLGLAAIVAGLVILLLRIT